MQYVRNNFHESENFCLDPPCISQASGPTHPTYQIEKYSYQRKFY